MTEPVLKVSGLSAGYGEHAAAADVSFALDAGEIGGAAIDVMCEEPPNVNSRLLQHPKCIVTPHVAAFSCDFEKNFFAASVEKLRQICEAMDDGEWGTYPPSEASRASGR